MASLGEKRGCPRHRADSENEFVFYFSDSLFLATAKDQPGSRQRAAAARIEHLSLE
jgi:hypothetical protein